MANAEQFNAYASTVGNFPHDVGVAKLMIGAALAGQTLNISAIVADSYSDTVVGTIQQTVSPQFGDTNQTTVVANLGNHDVTIPPVHHIEWSISNPITDESVTRHSSASVDEQAIRSGVFVNHDLYNSVNHGDYIKEALPTSSAYISNIGAMVTTYLNPRAHHSLVSSAISTAALEHEQHFLGERLGEKRQEIDAEEVQRVLKSKYKQEDAAIIFMPLGSIPSSSEMKDEELLLTESCWPLLLLGVVASNMGDEKVDQVLSKKYRKTMKAMEVVYRNAHYHSKEGPLSENYFALSKFFTHTTGLPDRVNIRLDDILRVMDDMKNNPSQPGWPLLLRELIMKRVNPDLTGKPNTSFDHYLEKMIVSLLLTETKGVSPDDINEIIAPLLSSPKTSISISAATESNELYFSVHDHIRVATTLREWASVMSRDFTANKSLGNVFESQFFTSSKSVPVHGDVSVVAGWNLLHTESHGQVYFNVDRPVSSTHHRAVVSFIMYELGVYGIFVSEHVDLPTIINEIRAIANDPKGYVASSGGALNPAQTEMLKGTTPQQKELVSQLSREQQEMVATLTRRRPHITGVTESSGTILYSPYPVDESGRRERVLVKVHDVPNAKGFSVYLERDDGKWAHLFDIMQDPKSKIMFCYDIHGHRICEVVFTDQELSSQHVIMVSESAIKRLDELAAPEAAITDISSSSSSSSSTDTDLTAQLIRSTISQQPIGPRGFGGGFHGGGGGFRGGVGGYRGGYYRGGWGGFWPGLAAGALVASAAYPYCSPYRPWLCAPAYGYGGYGYGPYGYY
jgi:hypothetical protein